MISALKIFRKEEIPNVKGLFNLAVKGRRAAGRKLKTCNSNGKLELKLINPRSRLEGDGTRQRSVPSNSDAAPRCLAIIIDVILQPGVARHLFLNPGPEDSPSNEDLFERWANSITLPALVSDDPHFGRGVCKSGTATIFLGHFEPPQHNGICIPGCLPQLHLV